MRRYAIITAIALLLAAAGVAGQGQSPPLPAPQPSGISQSSGPASGSSDVLSATVFVVDVSGSMDDQWPGGRKIDSAKAALETVTNLIRHDVATLNLEHLFGIVAFTSDADVRLPLSSDLDLADGVIAGLEPETTTNVGAGLVLGLDELRNQPTVPRRLMVLLSDGMTNTGMEKDEIIAGPVAECASANIPIYVCGYGEPSDASSMDEPFLEQIADETGGKYYHASTGTELENIYVHIRHESLGKILEEVVGQIAQGETKQATSVDVEGNTEELHVSLNWPGSWLDLLIYDPNGTLVDANYQGASLQTAARPVYAIIRNPLAGAWNLSIRGQNVPGGQTGYHLVASGRIALSLGTPGGGGGLLRPPGSWRGGAPTALIVAAGIALALCAVLVAAIILVALRGSQTATTGHLLAASGGRVGVYPINSPHFVIGRAATCNLRILDDSVSGAHAEIMYAAGTHCIRDLGSRNGTFVNDEPVAGPRMLRAGDKIRVGQTELTFSPQDTQAMFISGLGV